MNMAKRGQLPGKLGEQELIGLLENINQQTKKTTTIKVSTNINHQVKRYKSIFKRYSFFLKLSV